MHGLVALDFIQAYKHKMYLLVFALFNRDLLLKIARTS